MLQVLAITKTVGNKDFQIEILHGVSMEVQKGEILAIMGPSGCGKSTLLGIMAGLDAPTTGKVLLDNQDMYALAGDKLDIFRNKNISILFQNQNLVTELCCLDNVTLPLVFGKDKSRVSRQDVSDVLSLVGLSNKKGAFPYQMSGGEQQRAGIARALLMNTKVLFADEPTGSLDQANGQAVIDVFRKTVVERGLTIVLVTHDFNVANQCDRIINMRDGILV